MTKEYIFTMDFDDGAYQKQWKCVVSDDKCVTYADDVECETFLLDTPVRKPHVIQLDTVAQVFDEKLPLQVENGMPFLKMDGVWECSDTTDEDRLQANIMKYKKDSLRYGLLGVGLLIFYVVDMIWLKWMTDVPISLSLGLLCIVSGVITLIRIKNELEAMGREMDWSLPWKEIFKK